MRLSGERRIKHVANEATILSQQLSEQRGGRLLKLWLRAVYPHIDCIIAPCQASGRDLVSRFGVSESKLRVIYNSVDVEALRSFGMSHAFEASGSPPEPRIISVGSLRPVKGQRFLLLALKEVMKFYPYCRLEILGEGPERPFLSQLAKELGIESRVQMPGVRSPYASIADADVFVLPSLREGLPGALLEAMALKVPAIASSVGGVPEIIEDGKNGFLVRPGEWREIADRIVELLNDRTKRDLFAANGLKTVEEKFDVRKNGKKLEEVFLDLCSS